MAPELVEQGCPIAATEGVAQRLRPLVVQRIDEVEERAPVSVVRTDQPQHQIRVVRRLEPQVG